MCSDTSAKSGGPLGGGGGGGNVTTGGGGKSQKDLQQVSDDVVTTKPSSASPNPSGAGTAAPDPFAPASTPVAGAGVSIGTAPQSAGPSGGGAAPSGGGGGGGASSGGGNGWVDALSNPHGFAVKKFGEGVMNAPKGSSLGDRFANGGKNLHDSLFGPSSNAPRPGDSVMGPDGKTSPLIKGTDGIADNMADAGRMDAYTGDTGPLSQVGRFGEAGSATAGMDAAGEAAGADAAAGASGIGGLLASF